LYFAGNEWTSFHAAPSVSGSIDQTLIWLVKSTRSSVKFGRTQTMCSPVSRLRLPRSVKNGAGFWSSE
jgi:hypothetical protein